MRPYDGRALTRWLAPSPHVCARTLPVAVTATRAGGDLNRMNAPVEEMTGAAITSASYLKRSPAIPWSTAETEKLLRRCHSNSPHY